MIATGRASEIAQHAERLREEIRRHERLYYVDARPEIADAEFDRLMKELAELEATHPELATLDSPTRRVGGEPAEGFATVEHPLPMLSLENAYSWEDAEAWRARLVRVLGSEPPAYVAELKIDGLSIAVRYEDGVLAEVTAFGFLYAFWGVGAALLLGAALAALHSNEGYPKG